MEKILKNADTFLQILDTAMSPYVSTWDTAHLKRALNWAEHFQKIHQTYHTKPKIRATLNEELRKLAYRNCVLINRFGFDFLENCKDFLVGKLRVNLNLNIEVYKVLVSLEGRSSSKRRSVEDENKDLDSLEGNSSEVSSWKRRCLEDQVILHTIHNIKSTLNTTDSGRVVKMLCFSIEEAERFTKQCTGHTTAPQRAVTTLLTRVSQQQLEVIVRCLCEGSEGVISVVLEWVHVYCRELWGRVEVDMLAKASARSPATCQAHLEYILTLFSACGSVNCKEKPTAFKSNSTCNKDKSDPIDIVPDESGPVSDPEQISVHPTPDPKQILVHHVVTLHAVSPQCARIVETLLQALRVQSGYHGVLAGVLCDKLTYSTQFKY